jgi:hypothetical protein
VAPSSDDMLASYLCGSGMRAKTVSTNCDMHG